MARSSQSAFGRVGLMIPLVAVGLCLALIPPTAAWPQTELATGLEECAALSADGERLACYDRLQLRERGGGDEGADAARGDVDAAAAQADTDVDAARADRAANAEAAEVTATRPSAARANESRRDDGIEVTIVDVRRNLSGLAIFQTQDNGVWMQISTRSRTYPQPPFSARITGGLMGGRFLTPDSGGVAVRVRGPD